MTEPTARDLLVCVEMNNARIRGPDGASARVLAAYREELLAASAQSAEPQEEEVLLDIRHRLYAEAVERSVGWSAWTPNEAYKTGFEGGIDATFDILRARLAMKRHLAAPAQSAEPQEAEAQRHEIRFIDATPHEGYIRRILEAYIDDSYYSDNTAGLPPENEVCKMMNKWREERNTLLRAALARLASKPSQDERSRIIASAIRLNGVTFTGFRHHTIIGYLVDCGFPTPIGGEEGFIDDTGRFLSRKDAADLALRVGQINKTLMPNGELDSADIFPRRARPSREEEMREQIERIKHDCENALRSSTHHKCDYLSLIQSINDRLARAALAQGGARDEGEGKR